MNQLAKLQIAGDEEHFLQEYYRLREKEERRFYSRLSLKQRIMIHPLILGVYRLKNFLSGHRCEVLYDRRKPTGHPIIFALTHVGKFDIEVVSEAIGDHYTLLSGDYEHIQGIIDAPFIGLNGAIYFNERVKEDRQQATQKMVALLREGGNLMYFPEGTWNLHPVKPMLPCYWGIIDVARRGDAAIIPVAAEQYGKRFKVAIGENFYVDEYPDTPEGKSAAISDFRDILATLKWEIWESEPAISHKSLTGSEWDEYIAARFREWPYFNLPYIDSLIFKPKGITPPEEAFAHLRQLVPRKECAFLFRDLMTDREMAWQE